MLIGLPRPERHRQRPMLDRDLGGIPNSLLETAQRYRGSHPIDALSLVMGRIGDEPSRDMPRVLANHGAGSKYLGHSGSATHLDFVVRISESG